MHHEPPTTNSSSELHSSYPEYLWYPGVLANTSHSAERLGQNYHKFLATNPSTEQTVAWVRSALSDGLGIHDPSNDEVGDLVSHPDTSPYTFADMVSRRSQTGWSTHGHSAADVNIFASDSGAAAPLVGNHENTEVGEFLRDYLGVDVHAITKELREKGVGHDTVSATGETVSWMGKLPEKGERLDGQDHLDHYHGDFKKHKRCEICGM